MKIRPKESDNWWDDEDFQDRLASLLVHDEKTLKDVGALLSPEDFRPLAGSKNGIARQLVAQLALEHWHRTKFPLGKLLRADALEHAQRTGWGDERLKGLRVYVKGVLPVSSSNGMCGKVRAYKSQVLKASAIEQLTDLQVSGDLTDDKWREITESALVAPSGGVDTINYMETARERIARRAADTRRSRTPWTFIDPLDSMIRTVGPGQFGLVVAPYKRGKSSFLEWLAVAYARQRIDVLVVTLEDSKDIVEDRLDAIVTGIRLDRLAELPVTSRRRFDRFRVMFPHSRIEILDGTGIEPTVPWIEGVVRKLQDKGFDPGAILIDYDEKLRSVRRYKEKRFELDEIYNDMIRMNSNFNSIGWTAAQTQRDTRTIKILAGDKVAEDIGKIRKATCALTLGKGDWTDDSIYVWVAAHKADKMEVGCEIVPDRSRTLIYDPEATARAMRENGEAEREREEEAYD